MGLHSTLNPQGPGAAAIAELWWVMLIIAVIVAVIVLALLTFALVRSRASQREDRRDVAAFRFVLIGGAVVPALILVGVFMYALRVTGVLAVRLPPDALTVQAIGHQWWWEVRYPAENAITANEVVIPVGRPVRISVTSEDVIHSFWVPSLQGKIDTIPGQTNTFWLEASRPGVYRGECAEYCGLQHANMNFTVRAVPEEEFSAWVAVQRQPAREPRDALLERGKQVFLGSACVYCHQIRGTNATGRLGPDLTHLASRSTIGAGVLPNTPGNLAGWVVNAQAHKPGNKMPPMYMSSGELDALLAYLGSLQ